MSRRYTPHHKEKVLQRLAHNAGHIALTSAETGVPERTLRDWRLEEERAMGMVPRSQPEEELSPPPPENFFSSRHRHDDEVEDDSENPMTNDEKLEDASNVYRRLRRLRNDLLRHIDNLSLMLDDDENASVRALALSRLLDRVIRLDALIEKGDPAEPPILRFEFRHPDGTIHERPPWAMDWDEEDLPQNKLKRWKERQAGLTPEGE